MAKITPKKQVVAILQARASSTRLPGKVLKPILKQPMLALQIERVRRATLIDNLVVATSTDTSDTAIELLCNQLHIPCYRGSLEDVLSRYYGAAKQHPANHYVRLTGDCPLADPNIIDAVISLHLSSGATYTSNCLPPTLPDGLDVEIFTAEALFGAYYRAQKPSEREHVTPYIRKHTEEKNIANYLHPIDLSQHRWTVDEPEDFLLINRIYKALYPCKQNFLLEDILQLLNAKPELKAINAGVNRNEGLERSIAKDRSMGYE